MPPFRLIRAGGLLPRSKERDLPHQHAAGGRWDRLVEWTALTVSRDSAGPLWVISASFGVVSTAEGLAGVLAEVVGDACAAGEPGPGS
ncbi:hypothetical protein DDE74_06105 [Streptomyces lydicus]|uniref:Uncharacterized protein n=1 Tax=Streptomyces lydicus TaxID=47763 RepID=A0A3Q9K7E8_9ACTN|nr:hypothetical protein DDE74_06105 [Streptomyces lydicus]